MIKSQSPSSLFPYLSNLNVLRCLTYYTTSSSAQPLLHTEEIFSNPTTTPTASPSSPTRYAIILHGLLGNAKNLKTFATMLCKHASSSTSSPWKAVLVDLRGHGKSAALNFQAPHNLHSAASDVIQLIKAQTELNNQRPPDLLIGHSLGGKISLEVIHQLMNGKYHHQKQHQEEETLFPAIGQVWVLDSMPAKLSTEELTQLRENIKNSSDSSSSSSDEDLSLLAARNKTLGVWNVLQAVNSIPLPVPSRQWLINEMTANRGFTKDLAAWLASNLQLSKQQSSSSNNKNEYTWTFDLDIALALYESYCSSEYWETMIKSPVKIHLVKAMKSGRWKDVALSARLGEVVCLDRSRVLAHQLDAGHWLHATHPKELADMIVAHL